MIALEHEYSFVDYHKSFCCHNTCRYLKIKATTIEHLRRRFDRPVKSQDVFFYIGSPHIWVDNWGASAIFHNSLFHVDQHASAATIRAPGRAMRWHKLSPFLHIESTCIGGDDYIAMLSREMSSPSFSISDQHTSAAAIGAPGRAARCHRLSFYIY